MADYTAVRWSHSVLLVIDMQRDFVDGAAPVAGSAEIVPALARVIEVFRAARRPVVHVIRYYRPGDSDVDTVRRHAVEQGLRLAVPDDAGAQIPEVLTGGVPVRLDAPALLGGRLQTIGGHEVVMFKPRWSAFYRTGLEHWLRERGIDSVVVAGCNLPNCPRATLFDATERDFRAAIVADAVSQASQQRLDDLRLIGVGIVTSADVYAAFQGQP